LKKTLNPNPNPKPKLHPNPSPSPSHLELGRLPRGEALLEPLGEGLAVDEGLQPLGARGREARLGVGLGIG